MPKLTQSIPAYRRHRFSRQAFVELSGRRFYLGRHGTADSKAKYDRHIAEWLANGRTVPANNSGTQSLTVTELCVRYLKFAAIYYQKNDRPTTEVRDIKLSLKPLRRLYGREPCGKFGPKCLKAVRRFMIASNLSRGVVNQRIGRIKRAFKWAVEEELISVRTYQRLAAVPGLKRGRSEARETAPVMPVGDDIVAATLAVMPKIPADMVRLQRLTGARPGEVCLMRPCDIARSSDVWEFVPESHKTQHHGK